MIFRGGSHSHASVAAFTRRRGRSPLPNMNPLKMNGGIFVRNKILKLSVIDQFKKQILAIVDNYEGGFNPDELKEVAEMVGCTETQANNAFLTLVGLRFIKLNHALKWVLNEDANWMEGSL
jgi:hypothetical protein